MTEPKTEEECRDLAEDLQQKRQKEEIDHSPYSKCRSCSWKGYARGFGHNDFYCPECGMEDLEGIDVYQEYLDAGACPGGN